MEEKEEFGSDGSRLAELLLGQVDQAILIDPIFEDVRDDPEKWEQRKDNCTQIDEKLSVQNLREFIRKVELLFVGFIPVS